MLYFVAGDLMSIMAPSHIEIDDKGVARIAGTRMKVRMIAEDRRYHGRTPEQMREDWPHLSLAQIYAALSYYYAHQAEMDAEMDRLEAEVERMRAEAPPPNVTRAELERRKRELRGE